MQNIKERIAGKMKDLLAAGAPSPTKIRLTKLNESEFVALGADDVGSKFVADMIEKGVREAIGHRFLGMDVEWDHDGEDFELE